MRGADESLPDRDFLRFVVACGRWESDYATFGASVYAQEYECNPGEKHRPPELQPQEQLCHNRSAASTRQRR
jgi:hypothetical protein